LEFNFTANGGEINYLTGFPRIISMILCEGDAWLSPVSKLQFQLMG